MIENCYFTFFGDFAFSNAEFGINENINATRVEKMLFIIHKKSIFVVIIHHLNMKPKKQILFPKHQKIMEQVGENIKLARKRRRLTTIQVSERAGIDRSTLYQIEKGSGSVSMAAYFNTLRVLGLQDDFLKLAADDVFGRKLQDLSLIKNS